MADTFDSATIDLSAGLVQRIQTSRTNPTVVLDKTGLTAKDANGNVLFNLNAQTGNVTAQGLSIGTGQLTGQITAGQIANGAVTTPTIAVGAITGTTIANGTIQTANIGANAITTGLLAAGAVTTATLAAGAVTAAKLSVGSLEAITANMGTLTSGVIQTAPSGARTVVDANVGIRTYNATQEVGRLDHVNGLTFALASVAYSNPASVNFNRGTIGGSTYGWLFTLDGGAGSSYTATIVGAGSAIGNLNPSGAYNRQVIAAAGDGIPVKSAVVISSTGISDFLWNATQDPIPANAMGAVSYGTASITLSGATSGSTNVNHGLGKIPVAVVASFLGSPTQLMFVATGSFTASQFTLTYIRSTSVSQTFTFSWIAIG